MLIFISLVSHIILNTVIILNVVDRFYIREDGTAMINMADAQFSYSYEYQGNAPKLVHTPLTDKCYLTLTQVSNYLSKM